MDHKKETPDRSKINMSDPRELKYWCKALEASEEQLAKAVDKVGNSAATVRKELALSAKQADAAENGQRRP
jgi:3-oxoacyl-[acyl-carrier-protein] synthase III